MLYFSVLIVGDYILYFYRPPYQRLSRQYTLISYFFSTTIISANEKQELRRSIRKTTHCRDLNLFQE